MCINLLLQFILIFSHKKGKFLPAQQQLLQTYRQVVFLGVEIGVEMLFWLPIS
jgi:hypothetical protein